MSQGRVKLRDSSAVEASAKRSTNSLPTRLSVRAVSSSCGARQESARARYCVIYRIRSSISALAGGLDQLSWSTAVSLRAPIRRRVIKSENSLVFGYMTEALR
jgi:hypothetical protein